MSEITVLYPNFDPAQIEKGKVHIQNGEWDNALEAISNITVRDKTNPEAIRIFCFYLLARENDIEALTEKIDELRNALKQSEPRNADLWYNYAQLFVRFCGRNPEVIKLTLGLLENALIQQPDNPDYLCEHGTQKTMIGDFAEAQSSF